MTRQRTHRNTQPSRTERTGIALSVLAAMVWPVQAAVVAWLLAALLTGPAQAPVLLAPVAFLALAVLRKTLDAAAQRHLSNAADARIAALRREIIDVEQAAADPSHIGGAGALAALATDKLETLRPYFLRYAPSKAKATILPLILLGLTLWHSWAVALVLLLAGPLIPVFMALVGWAAKAASERQMAEIGDLSDLLVDRLAALSDMRLIGAGEAVIDSFAAASDSLRHRTLAVLKIAFLSSTVLELFAALGVAMVAVWVGFSLLGELGWGAWGGTLSPMTGIFLLLLAPDFFQPLRDLAAAWHDRAAADAVMGEITRWREDTRALRLGGGESTLESTAFGLRGVVFRGRHYPDLDIAKGDRLAITGPSGSGKTSLLRLLAGLDRPDAGSVLLGDKPLDNSNADVWRERIGWMPPAPHFLNRSLRHNIGFGAPLDSDLLRRSRSLDVIEALPKGDQTLLGAQGAGLSGGEARRITLARALHGAPSLILADEPTADLDADTARAITDALLAFADAGGTLIVATHDADLIARLGRELRLAAEGNVR